MLKEEHRFSGGGICTFEVISRSSNFDADRESCKI